MTKVADLDSTRLQLIGALDLESGQLERPLDFDDWPVPLSIDVEDDRLVWGGQTSDGVRRVRSGPGLLVDFLRLTDATVEEIAAYARTWGVLGICEHGFPASHNPHGFLALSALLMGYPDPACSVRQTDDGRFWEPAATWRMFAREAVTVIDAAAKLHDGKANDIPGYVFVKALEAIWNEGRADTVDHRLEQRWDDVLAPEWYTRGPDDERWVDISSATLVGQTVDKWLQWAGIRVCLDWLDDNGPKPRLRPHGGLIGALAMQLMFQVVRGKGIAYCHNCGRYYVPRRRPRSGRSYCGEEQCQKASKADASRDYRNRTKRLTSS